MACKPPCVEEYAGTYRQKWEYVKRFYGGLNAPSASLNAWFAEDYAAWQLDVASGRNSIFEKWLQWKFMTGSVVYRNLPQWERDQHVGHCWAPCPYSTQSNAIRTRHMLGLSDADPLPTQNDHTGGDGRIIYLRTNSKGSLWGFECTFDNCPYYVANGERFFYV
jgi:hypothetical protein